MTTHNAAPTAGEDALFAPADLAAHADTDEREYANYSYARETVNRFLANKGAVVSLVVIALIVLVAIAAPIVSPYSYSDVNSQITNLPPRIPGLEQLGICDGTQNGVDLYAAAGIPNEYHLFGTDGLGRDVWTRVWEGTRISLVIALIAVVVGVLIGIVYGLVSGYFGGKVDLTMERIVDILAGIPWIVLMTVLCIKLGQTFFVFILALTLTGWIGTESITRSQFYRYRGREYVLASKTLGAKAPRLIFRHILPNAIGTIVTSSVLIIPSVIFNEATISYLGLGFQGMSSLGVILSRYQDTLRQFPYQLAVPAIIIALLMICFNLFGNGLRDAFNPSLKGTD